MANNKLIITDEAKTNHNIEGELLSIDITRKDNEMFQVDVSWLAKGTYLIKFQNSQTIKVINDTMNPKDTTTDNINLSNVIGKRKEPKNGTPACRL